MSASVAIRSQWTNVVGGFLFTVPLVVAIRDHVVSVSRVEGESMQPTLNPEPDQRKCDYILIWKWGSTPLRRGEVVALHSPEDPDRTMVKRVMAFDGDIIRDRHRTSHRIKRGQCWVEGDNPMRSDDSNRFGQIPAALIQGRACAIIWPPNRIGGVKAKAVSTERFIKKGPKNHDAIN